MRRAGLQKERGSGNSRSHYSMEHSYIVQHESVKALGLKPGKEMCGFVNKALAPSLPGIYVIYCLRNRRFYVGRSNHIRKRALEHVRFLQTNVHPNPHLQRAYNRYGESSFLFFPVEIVEDEDALNLREFHWATEYRSFEDGFNIAPMVQGGFCTEAFSAAIRGEKNGTAKLTEEKVVEICTLINDEELSMAQIAQRYSVSSSAIIKIRNGAGWRHVGEKHLDPRFISQWGRKKTPAQKLTEETIQDICQRLNLEEPEDEIAKKLNVSVYTVNSIRRGVRNRALALQYLTKPIIERWAS